MKSYFSISLMIFLSFAPFAYAGPGGFVGTCHWKASPAVNEGDGCQASGSAGDTVAISALSGVKITIKNSSATQSDFDGTSDRPRNKEGAFATTHAKSNNIDYLQFATAKAKNGDQLVLVDPDLLSKLGSGLIILRRSGNEGCQEAIFDCGGLPE